MSVRNKKTIQLDEERNTEIERANRILLEKITKILKSKHHCPKDACINFQQKESNASRSSSQNIGNYSNQMLKSLNNQRRMQDKRRISHENQKIVDRLMSQRSQYDWGKLRVEDKRHKQLLNKLSHFPRGMSNREFNCSASPQIAIIAKIQSKRSSLSPIKTSVESFMSKRGSIELNQTDVILDTGNTKSKRIFQSQLSSSKNTITLQPLDDSNNPYASLEKQDYDNLLTISKRVDAQSQLKNNQIINRDLSSGSNLDVVSEKPNRQRGQKKQPIQPGMMTGSNFRNTFINAKSGGDELNPPVPNIPKIFIHEDSWNEYQNQKLPEFSAKISKKLDVTAKPTKQRNNSPDEKLATKDPLIKQQASTSNTRYQSRIKPRKQRHITPLKVWGIDSQNSILSGLTSVGGGNSSTREVLYQKTRKVEGIPMKVEVSHFKNKVFITCIEQENQRQHIIQMFKKQADFLVEQTDLKFLADKKMMRGHAKIVKLLEFRFNRLVINENKDIRRHIEKGGASIMNESDDRLMTFKPIKIV